MVNVMECLVSIMPREHGDSGEFVQTVTEQEVLDVFNHVRGPVVLSADVANQLDCSRETARRKLKTLYDDGELDRRKVSRRVIYWRETSLNPTVDTVLDELDVSDSRRKAVRACLEYLQEHGSAQKKNFVEDVYSEHTAGYESPGGWWNKIGKEHLKAVVEQLDSFSAPVKEGSHTWRYHGTGQQ